MTGRNSLLIWLVLLPILAAGVGCARLKPVSLIDAAVQVPEKKVILFFVDGVNRALYRELLAQGRLPNIEKYLMQRGMRVEDAVTAVPSITYAITTTLATGQVPGHHGILGNRFFDRNRLFFADYTTTETYRDVDGDYRSATIYEILDDVFSVTIQTALRRGVYRKIDNWASSGLRWFFGQIVEIDCLTAERFELIGAIARRAGRWPGLIFAYFPACDEMGHRYSPNSQQYRRCLINADEQIGRICATLELNGLLDSTYLVLVSDHGMANCLKENYINPAELVRKKFNLRITEQGPGRKKHYSDRAKYFAGYDAVLVNGGNRRAIFYLRNGSDWSARANEEQIKPIADYLVQQQAVCLAAYRKNNAVLVQNAKGRALIERAPNQAKLMLNEKQYRYRVIDETDPLGYSKVLSENQLLDGDYHSGKEWLAGTAKSKYPDLPVQITEMFDSSRAGDLVLFAAEGWDFARENIGGHGSIIAVDMQVPMVFAGPGISPADSIATARTVDIAPTIIEMLDGNTQGKYRFDGKSLLKELREK